MDNPNIARLAALFGSLSLLSFGGSSSVVPEMHTQAVSVYHWMSGAEFAALYAISQAAPGPSILVVTLIGLKAAGIPGALVATLAMLVPAGILTWIAGTVWKKSSRSPWHRRIEAGLAPLVVGLVFASAWLMSRSADHGPGAVGATLACSAISLHRKVHPLVVIVLAAIAGWAGWV